MGIVNRNLKLGNRERMIRTCLNQDIDRIPLFFMQGAWVETMARWRKEGMKEEDWSERFGFDIGFVNLPVNIGYCPGFERVVLSEDDDTRTIRDEQGVTFVEKKGYTSIPRYIDYPVKTREDWELLKKERLDLHSPERFPDDWHEVIQKLKEQDAAIQIGTYPHGLFGTLREMMGAEELLINFIDEPELVHEIMDYLTDFWIAMYQMILRDVQIDIIHIWEDMSGKQGSLISPAMFREFMMPNYKKIVSFAKENDIPIISVDTDGNVDGLMPLFEESGINFVLPFEVQAGCDVVALKKQYPNIAMLGGYDKRAIAIDTAAIDHELNRLRQLFDFSGYIPAPDHQIHPEVSYENFCYFIEKLRKMIFT